MAEFDKKADTWDDDPIRVDRAKVIAERMSKVIDLTSIDKALEYGSGTGLLSFALKDQLTNVVLMDESIEMTEKANEKCKALQVNHFKPIQCDLLNQELSEQTFDLIYILLTLHHIEDTETILKIFNNSLNEGGILAIIDLDKEDGSFHEHNTHFHNGFDRSDLEDKLRSSGFEPSSYETCYELERDYDSIKTKYPLFLMVSKKKE